METPYKLTVRVPKPGGSAHSPYGDLPNSCYRADLGRIVSTRKGIAPSWDAAVETVRALLDEVDAEHLTLVTIGTFPNPLGAGNYLSSGWMVPAHQKTRI